MGLKNVGTYDESVLVDRLRIKDTAALEYLYDNYSSALFGIINRIIPDKKIAEEVLQDSFIKIWEKIDTYDENKGRLFTWMLRLCKNQAIDCTRSKGYSTELKSTPLDFYVSESKQDDKEGNKEDYIGLPAVIETLPDEQKYVIHNIYFQGFSHRELAKESGIPLGTIKTRVAKALKVLRQVLHE